MFKFDQNTGLMVKQWSVRRRLCPTPGCTRKRRIRPRKAMGPRSLVDMSIYTLALNIDQVSEAHLVVLPLSLKRRLWNLVQQQGASLHAWKLFLKILLEEGDANDKRLGLYRFCDSIGHPEGSLKQYIEPLTSPSTDFITHLTIGGGCAFTIPEMLYLTDMKNLGVLELIESAAAVDNVSPPINDRIIRAWTEKDDPFPLLRVLRIWGKFITGQSLQWVSKLPSLALFDVIGPKNEWRTARELAKKYAWKVVGSHKELEYPVLRYLKLLSPAQVTDFDEFKTLNYTESRDDQIDSYLISFLSSPERPIVRLTFDEAPPLLEYLYNGADIDLPEADFRIDTADGYWGFWVYSSLGQQSRDRDLKAEGVAPDDTAVVDGCVIPSKPIACVMLGHDAEKGINDRSIHERGGLYEHAMRHLTFTRRNPRGVAHLIKREHMPPKANVADSSRLEPSRLPKRQKMKNMDDLLQTLSG